MRADADVGIVGAGIAGLTAANLLAARGFSVEVLERAPELRVTGAGVMLHPNGFRVLGWLGERLRLLGVPMVEQVTTDPDGYRTVVRWDEVWAGGELPLAVHRRALAEGLLDGLPAGTVHWGRALAELTQDDEVAKVRLVDGEPRRYRILVGADGVSSRTRAALGVPCRTQDLRSTYWRTTVPLTDRGAGARWRVWRAGTRFFGLMPIGRGRMHVFVQDVAAEAGLPPGLDTRAELLHLARGMAGAVPDVVAGLDFDEAVHRTVAVETAAEYWSAGRAVLIGDAVHAVAPATTQGAGLAIEDAAVLAAELHDHGPRPSALASFAKRRQDRVGRFVRRARLHDALIPALHRAGQARGRGTAESATWFRQLYAPLMAPP